MATKESIREVAASLGLSMTVEFVPWSLSRNAGEKFPSLNWKVTLHKGGRMAQTERECNGYPILTTDYGAGCGHCPSYTQGRQSVDDAEAVRWECENGRKALPLANAGGFARGKPILPELADVLHSLASDADAIDHPNYEDWASDLGYDPDSRKGEATYRACLEIALKLRAALGEDGLKELREAVQDY